jgi:perosamine synthetase
MEKTKTYESGLINPFQRRALLDAIEKGSSDPSFISALSGTGPVEEFEEAFARATGGKYALALSSGTAALHTALMASGIGPGDEVIVSPYTWGQSVSPVLFSGATVVFADIDPGTLTLDPVSVESRISNTTKAIIPVHLFGNPADMDTLCSIAERHGLAIIADAAQAFGALSKGRKIGSLGDAACFSLGRGKAVCGGEGGVLVTNSRSIYEQAIAVSQHPIRGYREILSDIDFPLSDELNWNYRIHPLAAVLALAELEVAKERIAYRRNILSTAHQELESIPHINPIHCYLGDSSAAYGIPLTFDCREIKGVSRQAFIESLESQGIMIQAGPVRVPIHLRPTFQQNNTSWLRVVPHPSHQKGSCHVAESRCEYQEMLLL